jgi:hypothetical protein
LGLSEQVAILLLERKKQIEDEMDRLTSAFHLAEGDSTSGGCLRLEEVYCVKDGRRYGPYGPYYYVYFHRTSGMEKRYLGKKADKFIFRKEVADRFRRLEEEYRRILSLERAMSGGSELPKC